MNISNTSNDKNYSFKGMWTNKTVLKGLEKISEHGTSFIATTSFVMAATVRPLAISATPNVKKENKEYAITNSIASALVKFALVESIAFPLENAIKRLENNPNKFLKQKTIDLFKKKEKSISNSRDFKFITQLIKQSIGLITAIPKSMLTVALIPILTDKLFYNKNINQEQNKQNNTSFSFKGSISDKTSKGIGKILDCEKVQKFAKKFSSKDTDISRNITILTDIILTGAFAHQTIKNDKINENCKIPLIMNTVYATLATIIGGYSIDSFIKKNTKNFIRKFSQLHKNDSKLPKYIEGINILRPTLVFASIYYGFLPMVTTYLADKTNKN